jgi:hypothetical protein
LRASRRGQSRDRASGEGRVAIVEVDTDVGVVTTIGEYEIVGTTLVIRGFHVSGLWAQALGLAAIRRHLCNLFREFADVDRTKILGARRTTGANPGRFPKPIGVTRSYCRRLGLA